MSDPPSTTPTTTAQTTTAAAPDAILPMPAIATLKLTSSDGYSATATFRHGPLRPAGNLQNGDMTLGSACSVDDQTDAVEPFQLAITNTTAKFAASPGISFGLDIPPGQSPPITAEIGYSDGPQCIDLRPGDSETDTAGLEPNDQLQPGQGVSATGFLIIPNYYSPAHPDGTPALVKDILIQIEPGGSGTFGIAGGTGLVPQTVDVQGQVENDGAGYAIRLPPGARSCIIAANGPPPYNVGNTPSAARDCLARVPSAQCIGDEATAPDTWEDIHRACAPRPQAASRALDDPGKCCRCRRHLLASCPTGGRTHDRRRNSVMRLRIGLLVLSNDSGMAFAGSAAAKTPTLSLTIDSPVPQQQHNPIDYAISAPKDDVVELQARTYRTPWETVSDIKSGRHTTITPDLNVGTYFFRILLVAGSQTVAASRTSRSWSKLRNPRRL